MGKIRICSKPPKPIVSLSETYTVLSSYKSGRVTLCLTPDGEYLFTVYGDISESTAKRKTTRRIPVEDIGYKETYGQRNKRACYE